MHFLTFVNNFLETVPIFQLDPGERRGGKGNKTHQFNSLWTLPALTQIVYKLCVLLPRLAANFCCKRIKTKLNKKNIRETFLLKETVKPVHHSKHVYQAKSGIEKYFCGVISTTGFLQVSMYWPMGVQSLSTFSRSPEPGSFDSFYLIATKVSCY